MFVMSVAPADFDWNCSCHLNATVPLEVYRCQTHHQLLLSMMQPTAWGLLIRLKLKACLISSKLGTISTSFDQEWLVEAANNEEEHSRTQRQFPEYLKSRNAVNPWAWIEHPFWICDWIYSKTSPQGPLSFLQAGVCYILLHRRQSGYLLDYKLGASTSNVEGLGTILAAISALKGRQWQGAWPSSAANRH